MLTPNIPALKAWEQALRSGEYQQTDGSLRTDNGFCCLGVACDIRSVQKWRRIQRGLERHWIWDQRGTDLDSETTIFYGVGFELQAALANANDNGVSFDGIADYIASIIRDAESGVNVNSVSYVAAMCNKYDIEVPDII